MSGPRTDTSSGWPASSDPEDKRKVIGELFIRVFEEVSGGIEDAHFLVQGTLYPDVIESRHA